MKRASLLSIPAIVTLLLPGLAAADPGELTPIAINTQGNAYGYFEYLPEAYDESQDWPVLIFLSGIGEFGNGEVAPGGGCPNGPNYGAAILCRNLRHGPQNLLWRQLEQGEAGLWDDVERPFIVIGPQNNAALWSYTPYNPTTLSNFIDNLIDNYAVDERRIYLTGMSMGGYSVPLSVNHSPNRYAAVSMMPGINGIPAGQECNATRNAWWIFHGENDGNPFNPNPVVGLGNNLRNCPDPHPYMRITMYENAGHNVWTRTIEPDLGMDDSVLATWNTQGVTVSLDPYDVDIYTWLLSHDKPSVDAGPDLVAAPGSTGLSATTIDDDAITYSWTQTGGAAATLNNADTATPSVTGLVVGTYEFQVMAHDSDGMWDTDLVTVEVVEGGGDDSASGDGSTGAGEESTGGGEDSTGAGDETTGGDGTTGGGDATTGGDDTTGGGDDTTGGGDDTTGGGGDTTGGDTTGGGDSTGGGDTGGSADPLDALDDSFDDASLAQWSIFGPLFVNEQVVDGTLVLEPMQNTGWHNASQASQLHQTVAGDFAVTTQVTVSNLTGGPATPNWRLGGVMMRDANAAGSNTYHGSFGTVGAWMSTEMVFEWKNTVSSASQLGWAPNTSGTGQIRLCRVGSQVRTMFRPDSASAWTVGNEQTRNDFGNELEVGPIAFSLNNPANFRAVFDFVDYATITSMTECEGVPVSYLELEGDGGAGDLAAADPAGGDDTAANAGCGCSADDEGHGGGFAFAILFGLLGLQRRRRTLT